VKTFQTFYVDQEAMLAIWANATWVADYQFSSKRLGDDRYRVTTDYPWNGSTKRTINLLPRFRSSMNAETKAQYTARIAALNDLARTAMGVTCKLVQTSGISALPARDQSRIRELVELFDAFTPDNNPHGERDFGSFTHDGNKVFWKIDYYDRNLEFGSEDPADPAKTRRVLTIMLASEY
jgi:hypothetical protein